MKTLQSKFFKHNFNYTISLATDEVVSLNLVSQQDVIEFIRNFVTEDQKENLSNYDSFHNGTKVDNLDWLWLESKDGYYLIFSGILGFIDKESNLPSDVIKEIMRINDINIPEGSECFYESGVDRKGKIYERCSFINNGTKKNIFVTGFVGRKAKAEFVEYSIHPFDYYIKRKLDTYEGICTEGVIYK